MPWIWNPKAHCRSATKLVDRLDRFTCPYARDVTTDVCCTGAQVDVLKFTIDVEHDLQKQSDEDMLMQNWNFWCLETSRPASVKQRTSLADWTGQSERTRRRNRHLLVGSTNWRTFIRESRVARFLKAERRRLVNADSTFLMPRNHEGPPQPSNETCWPIELVYTYARDAAADVCWLGAPVDVPELSSCRVAMEAERRRRVIAELAFLMPWNHEGPPQPSNDTCWPNGLAYTYARDATTDVCWLGAPVDVPLFARAE